MRRTNTDTSEKTYATKTITKQTPEGTLTATAELHSLSNQHPYFSITGELRVKGRIEVCGMMHDEIAKYVPEFAPYLKWHLTSTDGPMHYLANAHHHAGFSENMEDSRNMDHLRSTIVFGACPIDDANVKLEELNETELDQFLVSRYPVLMRQFKEDINTLFDKPVIDEFETTRIKTEIELPTRQPRKTPEEKKAEKRQAVIKEYDQDVWKATRERDIKLWLLDHDIKLDNVIWYSHTDRVCFGWRDKVSDAFASQLLDLASEFPFDYDIKAASKTYSS
jgi:hypothetical protein